MTNAIIVFMVSRILGIIVIAALAAGVIKLVRLTQKSGPEMQGQRETFKSRLPSWVKVLDFSLTVTLAALIFISATILVLEVRHLLRGTYDLNTMAGLFLIVTLLATAVILGARISNLITSSIPAIKKINETAMEGLPTTSLYELNRRLMRFLFSLSPLLGFAIIVSVVL